MSQPTTGGSSRATRTTAPGAIATTKSKDDKVQTTEITVKDVATATEYLIDGDLKSEDDDLSFEFLSAIAMQLSQQPKLSTKKASEAFKALAYLIRDLHEKRTVAVITDVIANAISLATKRVRAELEEATEMLSAAAVKSNNTVEELREECRNVASELKEAAEEVVASLGSVKGDDRQETREGGGGGRENSYAGSVKKKVPVPAVHAMAVARAELQKKRIRLIKATGMGGDGLGDLTEKQWVEKANMALTLLEGQEEDRPTGVNFVGVSKEKENMGVIFELNTKEAAGWLKDKKVMTAFLAKMGSMVDFKMQTYEVVVDYVPVSFDVDQPAEWKRVEQANGLSESAIKEVKWIKPTHLRSENQRTAIAIFRLTTREDANQIIENGLHVEGKKVWGRKQTQEPKRCLKCQCFGEHKAANCGSIHDVCDRCSRQHRTSSCEVNNKEHWECSNCKAAGNGNHKGHGAADRRCQIFLSRVDRMNKTRRDNNYKFFCTTDPATWETYEHRIYEGQRTTDVHGRDRAGPALRQGKGRLGGGKPGEGGGVTTQKTTVGGKGEMRTDTRPGGIKANANGNTQTEAPGFGNGYGVGGGSSGQYGDGARPSEGQRAYRQETQREPEFTQVTLNKMWKGKEREINYRAWSEDIDARMRELDRERDRLRSMSYD